MGRKAKTDPIDALMIAPRFGNPRSCLCPGNQDRIAGLRGLRADLLKTRNQYTNRLENCGAKVREHIERRLVGIGSEIAELDAKLRDALEATLEDAAKAALDQTVPGVGRGRLSGARRRPR